MNKSKNITISNFLEKDFLTFIQDYFSIKVNSGQYDRHLNKFLYGYRFYGDHLVETILQDSCASLAEITKTQIIPTYSLTYLCMYGDEYQKENDSSSEISTLLCLGVSEDVDRISVYDKEEEYNINSGDIIIYNTRDTRLKINSIKNKWLLIAELNFVDFNGPYKNNIYDTRPYLGFNQYSKIYNGEN